MSSLVSVSEAKSQVRAVCGAEDTLIDGYILSAIDYISDYVGYPICLTEKTRTITCDGTFFFPRAFQSIVSFKNADDEDVETKIINNRLEFTGTEGVYYDIIYNVGYTKDTLPKTIYQAILLLVGEFYKNRENAVPVKLMSIPHGVEELIFRHRDYPE